MANGFGEEVDGPALQGGDAHRDVAVPVTKTTGMRCTALFVGSTYGPRGITVAVRIGFDDNRALGKKETGGRTALPIFREMMLGIYEEPTRRPWSNRHASRRRLGSGREPLSSFGRAPAPRRSRGDAWRRDHSREAQTVDGGGDGGAAGGLAGDLIGRNTTASRRRAARQLAGGTIEIISTVPPRDSTSSPPDGSGSRRRSAPRPRSSAWRERDEGAGNRRNSRPPP